MSMRCELPFEAGGSVRVEQRLDALHVVMFGEFDVSQVGDMKRLSAWLLAQAPCAVMVDAGEVTFADSQFVGALVMLERCSAKAGHELRLGDASGTVRRVLELCGLQRLLPSAELTD